ncbi:MAG: family 16 glycoside hydrolase [Limisphaerales bacterium]
MRIVRSGASIATGGNFRLHMTTIYWLTLTVLSVSLAARPLEEIPENRKKQIENAAPAKAQVSPAQGRRLLVLITPPHLMEKDPHKGYCIPFGAYAFQILGKKTGAYEPVVSDDLTMLLPENIRQFDAIVLNNTSGPWITPTDEDLTRDSFKKHGTDKTAIEEVLRKSFLEFVKNGGGIVAIHFASGANRHWPEFKELIGATFTGHPWNEDVGIRVEEPDHPLVAAFGGKDFRLADEIYEYGPPYDRSALRVLLSLDTEQSNMGVQWIHRTDHDFALAWVKSFGKGRVFCTSFGHRTEIYWHPHVLAFYLDAVQFATGDLQAPTQPRRDESENGFTSLFNGKDLSQWDGDEKLWSVQDGAITGETTDSAQVKENNFLIWKGGQPIDFELRLKFKLVGGNSGIYFHAEKRPQGQTGEPLVGPQADFSADHRWTGVLMEYTKREILAERGQRVLIETEGKKSVVGSVGDPKDLLKAVKDQDWNDYTVIARGESVVLKINGVTMCEILDRDPKRTPQGYLALQVHTGPSMKVQFRDIRMKQFGAKAD